MTPVTFSFDWKDVNQAVASKALSANFNPKWWQTFGLLFGGAAVAALVDRALSSSNGAAGLFGFLVGVYACIAWSALRYRKMAAGIRNSPSRLGGVTVTLEQDGYRVHTATTENWAAWSTVSAIKPVKNMIVLAIGDVEYMPILDTALPDSLSRKDMVSLLENLTGLTA